MGHHSKCLVMVMVGCWSGGYDDDFEELFFA